MQAHDALILCGGAGRRVNGQDKPLLLFQGAPLISRITRELASLACPVWISANRNFAEYRSYGTPVADAGDHSGPLAGILSVWPHVSAQHLLVVPGDGPDVDACLLEQLCEQGALHALVSVQDAGGLQPLYLYMARSEVQGLSQYVAAGGHSPAAWLRARSAHIIDIAPRVLRNLNTLQDFNGDTQSDM